MIEKPWQALSMEEQAIRLAWLIGHSEADLQKLADIYESAKTSEYAAASNS